MGNSKKLSQVDTSANVAAVDFFIGVRQNNDGTFTNFKYTPAQLLAYFQSITRQRIVISVPGTTITNAWFAGKAISAIATNGQYYDAETYFTQAGSTLTLINGLEVYNGQIITAIV